MQIRYYTNLIQSRAEWEFVGVFFDYESGLRRDGRDGLEAMLRKAYQGEIDYIITKSISRLSRNVLDTLIIIRALKEKGINMYFEKEDLNSIENEKEIDIASPRRKPEFKRKHSMGISEEIRKRQYKQKPYGIHL